MGIQIRTNQTTVENNIYITLHHNTEKTIYLVTDINFTIERNLYSLGIKPIFGKIIEPKYFTRKDTNKIITGTKHWKTYTTKIHHA